MLPGDSFVLRYWVHVSIVVLDMALKFLLDSFFKGTQNALRGQRKRQMMRTSQSKQNSEDA